MVQERGDQESPSSGQPEPREGKRGMRDSRPSVALRLVAEGTRSRSRSRQRGGNRLPDQTAGRLAEGTEHSQLRSGNAYFG